MLGAALLPGRTQVGLAAAIAGVFRTTWLPAQSASTRIDSFGIYRDLPGGKGMELVRQTDTIEAQLHISLGFHFTTSGLQPGERILVRKVVTHPPIHKPDGTVETSYDLEQKPVVRSDGTIAGFQGFGAPPSRWSGA